MSYGSDSRPGTNMSCLMVVTVGQYKHVMSYGSDSRPGTNMSCLMVVTLGQVQTCHVLW